MKCLQYLLMQHKVTYLTNVVVVVVQLLSGV